MRRNPSSDNFRGPCIRGWKRLSRLTRKTGVQYIPLFQINFPTSSKVWTASLEKGVPQISPTERRWASWSVLHKPDACFPRLNRILQDAGG